MTQSTMNANITTQIESEYELKSEYYPVDIERLVLMLNSHIKKKKFNVPKLDKKEQDITKIVFKIMELEGLNEEYIRDTIRGDLCAIYEEKFRYDAELKTLANEELPNREGIIIPY